MQFGLMFAVLASLPAPAQNPLVAPGGVVNAASGRAASSFAAAARGSLVSIYGSDLAAETALGTGVPIATQLAGTQVWFGDIAAPLLFVSPGQINAQVPFELPNVASVDLVVQTSTGTSDAVRVTLWSVDPGIFSVFKGDSQVSAANPISAGDRIAIFATGLGAVFPSVPSGRLGPSNPPAVAGIQPFVRVGGLPARVEFAGLAPGVAGGVYRVDVIAPSGISSPVTEVAFETGLVPGPPGLVVIEGVGPPTNEEGPLLEAMHQPRTGPRGLRYAPGRVIVKFRDGMPSASRLGSLRMSSSRTPSISSRPASADFDIVSIDPNEDAEAVAASFRGQPGVEYAQAAYVNHAMLVPNDPLYQQLQWNFPLIDLERAWDIQPRAGSTITVAVLDSGVAYTSATLHVNVLGFKDEDGNKYPALGAVTIPYSAAPQLGTPDRFVAPRDFIWNTTTPLDFDGHGTHVSGTIGQLTNDGIGTAGVAFNVRLMPVKVICGTWDILFNVPDADQCGTDDRVAQGIRYAADNGANIINMSIGRTGAANCGASPDQAGCAPAVEAAIRYAVGKGVFVVIAAGNDFLEGNPTEVVAEIASRVQGAVSVAAVGVDTSHANYSTTGPYVELAAPGGGAGAVNNGYVWQQTFNYDFTDTFLLPASSYGPPRFDRMAYIGYCGTSMAAPHVAGVAALLMQQGVTDPAAIEAALKKFATPCSVSRNLCDASVAPNRNDTFGFGLIQARNTLRGLGLAK
jgi:serine protease